VRSAQEPLGAGGLWHRGSDPKGPRTRRKGHRQGFGPGEADASSDVSFRQGLRTLSGSPTRLAYCPSGHHAKAVPFGGMLGMVAKDALGCPLRQYRLRDAGRDPSGKRLRIQRLRAQDRRTRRLRADIIHSKCSIRQEPARGTGEGTGLGRRFGTYRARPGTSVPWQRYWLRPRPAGRRCGR
jgi:hypothetical protein